MKKTLFSFIAIATMAIAANAQNVNIPDANFKAALVGNASINTNGDTEIQTSEASGYFAAINVNSQSISDLTGIEAFTNIPTLLCANNQLTTLDVSSNIALSYLVCDDNMITNLDLSNNTALTSVLCDNNQLAILNLTNCTNLEYIECYNNQISSLDVSTNSSLEELYCNNNQLTSIDISANSSLTNISCSDNQLTNLNLANGNNTNMDGGAYATVWALNNPNLTCIQKDVGYTPDSYYWRVDAVASYSDNCSSTPCTVNIPDANFKAYLVGNTAINTNGDTEIQCSEASGFTGTINCNGSNISDLTGIEAFTALTEIYCYTNNISSVDFTSNTSLELINISTNNLTSIDVSNNINLEILSCAENNISSIDVSGNPNVNFVNCNDNILTSLNVANENNTNFILFNATTNSNLTCIEVDDVTYSTTNWTSIDAGASFSLNCVPPCTVNIPDANFKAYLVGNAAINTNGDTEIQCSEASGFSGTINCNNMSISDLTGIEEFTAITDLLCHGNSLTSLDVSNNVNLTNLTCNNNSITSLDVSSNINLDRLFCQFNSISSLDVTNNNLLESFRCHNNSISSLDLSNNTLLESLRCNNNVLTDLDVSNNSNLITFVASNNNLTALNIANGNNTNIGDNGAIGFVSTNNPNLTCIQVDDVAYSTTNWTNIDAGASFSLNCSGTVLVNSINVQGQGEVSTITADGGTLQMVAAVLPANADDASYTWSVTNGTGTASIAGNGLLTAITNGTVDVVATANDGSGITGTTTITISNQTIGMNENQLAQFNIHPNPVKNELFIELNENQITQINIIDLSGKILLSQKQINGNSINVSSLTQGVYAIQISTEKGMTTSRFVKK